jgi:hypothetical protein
VGLHPTKKAFCTAKEIVHKIKRQSTQWEKIFANHVSGKVLTSKIYKELIQLNSKKKPIMLIIGEGPEKIIFKEDIQMSNRPMMNYSA